MRAAEGHASPECDAGERGLPSPAEPVNNRFQLSHLATEDKTGFLPHTTPEKKKKTTSRTYETPAGAMMEPDVLSVAPAG